VCLRLKSRCYPPAGAFLFQLSSSIMSFDKVTPGKNAPETFNVVIEISANSDPIKY
jgi:inorganic pyrophosphatase